MTTFPGLDVGAFLNHDNPHPRTSLAMMPGGLLCSLQVDADFSPNVLGDVL